jgi:putative membrane protein
MSDANILAKADAGDSAEVAVARYMAANTTNPRVKAYADLLERDHAKGISNVEGAAKKLSLTLQLPAGDTTAQETSHTLDHLKSLSGADRDSAFVNHEIADHKQDIADAKQMETAAKAPEVKSLLEKELPELRKHLDRAEALSHESGESKKK